MKFANRYAPPVSPSIEFNEPSMTDRSFKAECDINTIVNRCMQTGVMPQVEGGLYGDFVGLPDNLQDSYSLISDAQDRFMQMPSNVRAEFNNDPLQLISFINNDANRTRAVELGLIEHPAQVQSPAPVHPENTNVSNQAPSAAEN